MLYLLFLGKSSEHGPSDPLFELQPHALGLSFAQLIMSLAGEKCRI